MKELDNTIVLGRNNEQIFSEIDEEIVMLNIPNGEYYNFNSVASVIWNHFNQPKSLNSLLTFLQEKYQVSKVACEKDTKHFVLEMLEKRLLEVIDEEVE
jgi:hypothetical protein